MVSNGLAKGRQNVENALPDKIAHFPQTADDWPSAGMKNLIFHASDII
jgi:hypothetical protein